MTGEDDREDKQINPSKKAAEELAELMRSLDNLVEQSPWENSQFLRSVGKKIRDMRDELQYKIESKISEHKQTNEKNDVAHRIAKRTGMIEVYVSLYCSEGGKLRKWESVLAMLKTTLNSRPIYRYEKDVKSMIRAKARPENEAYCKLFISEAHLATHYTGAALTDKHGHEIIILKQSVFDPEDITSFIHNAQEYKYRQGRLLREQDLR